MPRVVALFLLVVSLAACSRGAEQEAGGPPPGVPVTVGTVVQKPVPVQVRAIGNVQASETVTVRARVGGIVAQIRFREGQDVEEGQVLFTLDRGPLEAALRQAEAQLERSRTQLENARKNADRYAELARQGFVAQQEYERFRTEVSFEKIACEDGRTSSRRCRASITTAIVPPALVTLRAVHASARTRLPGRSVERVARPRSHTAPC